MSQRDAPRPAALVPTGRQLKSYACVRSLERRGIRAVVASEHSSVPQFGSRYCTEDVRLPSGPDDLPAYRDALLELAARPEVRTVFPVREVDAYLLARDREAFEEHLSVVGPDLPTLRRAHDRLRLAELAAEAGVPYAETRLAGNVDAVDGPAVVKSCYNLLTGAYVENYPDGAAEEVKDVRYLSAGDRPDADALAAAMHHEPVVQEYVRRANKQLYCGLWLDGEPLATYQHREVRGRSWVGGGGVYRVTNHLPAVEAVAHDLLEHLEWSGLACIEYIQDAETGEWKFLEINPRMWQSLPAALHAGADFPHYCWQVATSDADAIDPAYEKGVGCHQLYGELGHLVSLFGDDSPVDDRPSIPRTALSMVGSLVTDPRFDYLYLDDPGLFLGALRSIVQSGDGGGRQFLSGTDTPQPSADGGRPGEPAAQPDDGEE